METRSFGLRRLLIMMPDKDSLLRGKNSLPVLLRRYGVPRVTAATTLLVVLISVAGTSVILYVVDGKISWTGLIIAILIPAILAPISSYNNYQLVHRLDLAEERLRHLSSTDDLTKIYNRRYFMERASQEFKRAKRYGHVFSIAIMDFDNFKDINDGYSHLAGDAALKHVARVCLESLRQMDVFARYGGDEFIFLFPETSATHAAEGVERILQALKQTSFKFAGADIPIRVSVGAASFHESMTDFDEILREADFALYSAKRQGGMQVIAHHT